MNSSRRRINKARSRVRRAAAWKRLGLPTGHHHVRWNHSVGAVEVRGSDTIGTLSEATFSSRDLVASFAQHAVLIARVARAPHRYAQDVARHAVSRGVALTRTETGFRMLDDVLGGGLVEAQTVLVIGEPGSGVKAFLVTLASLLASHGHVTLLASAERSAVDLLSALPKGVANLWAQATQDLDVLEAEVESLGPSVVLVESLARFKGNPPTNVRRLYDLARRTRTALFLTTYAGSPGASVATHHHTFDTNIVLARSGDGTSVRVVKNRFGPTPRQGVFKVEKGTLLHASVSVPE